MIKVIQSINKLFPKQKSKSYFPEGLYCFIAHNVKMNQNVIFIGIDFVCCGCNKICCQNIFFFLKTETQSNHANEKKKYFDQKNFKRIIIHRF